VDGARLLSAEVRFVCGFWCYIHSVGLWCCAAAAREIAHELIVRAHCNRIDRAASDCRRLGPSGNVPCAIGEGMGGPTGDIRGKKVRSAGATRFRRVVAWRGMFDGELERFVFRVPALKLSWLDRWMRRGR
jgi:hypothetical protein